MHCQILVRFFRTHKVCNIPKMFRKHVGHDWKQLGVDQAQNVEVMVMENRLRHTIISEPKSSQHKIKGGEDENLSSTTRSSPVRSSCQSQFRSENAPTVLEGHQMLSVFQKLRSNSKSANLNKNFHRNSKLRKLLTIALPNVDAKSEKFQLFEDLFQSFSGLIINCLANSRKTDF